MSLTRSRLRFEGDRPAGGAAGGAAGCRRLGVAACLSLCLLGHTDAIAQIGPVPGELNLFQLVARCDLVAHVRVRSGSLKFAVVEVQETLKGTAPLPVLRIAFRDFNLSRSPGEEPIVFPDGQEEVLFLVPHGRNARRQKVREKNKDLYTLFRGRQGRLTVPGEGPEVLIQAIRRLSEVGGLDPASQAEALENLLGGSNPILLQTALAEIERLQAARPALFPRLIGLLASASTRLRVVSLRVMAQIFTSARIDDESLDSARVALAAVVERARNDRDESVRAQAVASMAVWPERQDVLREIRAIANTDPAQAVRYEAEKALFKP